MTQKTRDRIAAAFDRELARSPVPAGLRAQALRETARVHRKPEVPIPRRASGGWRSGLQGAGALAAVLLVVVLIATVLVGGRVWRDWNLFNRQTSPAGAIDPAQLALLEARQWTLPSLQSGADCPMGPLTTIEYDGGPFDMYGGGPVYAINARLLASYLPSWAGYWDMKMFVDPSFTGPVLIRGRDLQTGQPLVFMGQYARGDVVGSATIGGRKFQEHLELALNVSQPTAETTRSGLRGGWIFRTGRIGNQQPSLCAGFQIDGQGFTETFVSYYS